MLSEKFKKELEKKHWRDCKIQPRIVALETASLFILEDGSYVIDIRGDHEITIASKKTDDTIDFFEDDEDFED